MLKWSQSRALVRTVPQHPASRIRHPASGIRHPAIAHLHIHLFISMNLIISVNLCPCFFAPPSGAKSFQCKHSIGCLLSADKPDCQLTFSLALRLIIPCMCLKCSDWQTKVRLMHTNRPDMPTHYLCINLHELRHLNFSKYHSYAPGADLASGHTHVALVKTLAVEHLGRQQAISTHNKCKLMVCLYGVSEYVWVEN